MIKEAIDKILELGSPNKLLDDGGREYVSKSVYALSPPPILPLKFKTISGLASFLTANKDRLKKEDLTVLVGAPDEVQVHGRLDEKWQRRQTHAISELELEEFDFGQWYLSEDFIIRLQTKFVREEKLESLIRFAGKTNSVKEAGTEDDGYTQRVTQKAGVTLVAEAAVPNPVVLRPFRTFSEVEQPESPFLFRVKQGHNSQPMFALFEADGGAWKQKAISNVAAYLQERLKDILVVS